MPDNLKGPQTQEGEKITLRYIIIAFFDTSDYKKKKSNNSQKKRHIRERNKAAEDSRFLIRNNVSKVTSSKWKEENVN